MKVFFGITLGIFFLSLMFWGVYNFGFKNNPSVPTISEKGTLIKESSPLNLFKTPAKITPVLTEHILSAIASTNSIFYYSLDEQAIRKSTFDGKDKETILSNLPGVPVRIVWSPTRESALINLKNSEGTTSWYTINLKLKTLTPLKPEISRIAWDNNGSKIIYQYTDPKTANRSLNIGDPDGSNWKILTSLGTKEFFVAAVPSSIFISYWNRPGAREKGSLSTVSLTGGSSKTLLSDQLGADFLWAPTGDKVLMSSTDATNPSKSRLSLMNESGGELRTLENVSTLIDKTTWSKDGHTLYYALPGSLPESTVLPDDYFEKNLHSQDSFWKMDTENNKTERLVDLKDLTEAYDATNLFLSPQEDYFFFIERKNQKLYKIDL